jgi:hypothetical protein
MLDPDRVVDIQYLKSRTSNRRLAMKRRTDPHKMIRPEIGARMK